MADLCLFICALNVCCLLIGGYCCLFECLVWCLVSCHPIVCLCGLVVGFVGVGCLLLCLACVLYLFMWCEALRVGGVYLLFVFD